MPSNSILRVPVIQTQGNARDSLSVPRASEGHHIAYIQNEESYSGGHLQHKSVLGIRVCYTPLLRLPIEVPGDHHFLPYSAPQRLYISEFLIYTILMQFLERWQKLAIRLILLFPFNLTNWTLTAQFILAYYKLN